MIGIGIGLPFIKSGLLDSDISAFISRVASDGGTLEAQNCLVTFVSQLKAIDL